MSGLCEFFCVRCFACSLFFVMTDFNEQRAAIKFCFLLRRNAAETIAILQTAYKGTAIGKIQVCNWFSHFEKMWNVNWWPTSIWVSFNFLNGQKCQKIHAIVFKTNGVQLNKSKNDEITSSSIQPILLENLGMRKVTVKCVPRCA